MQVKILTSIDDIKKLELLRYEVLGIKVDIFENNYHILRVLDGKMIPFALYYNNELVAGAYVTDERKSLYIDYLFVKTEYQNIGLKLGRILLRYIIDNKDIVEAKFNKQFDYCYLDPRDEKTVKIFSDMGFEKASNSLGEYKKHI